jgi:hypothetical protein
VGNLRQKTRGLHCLVHIEIGIGNSFFGHLNSVIYENHLEAEENLVARILARGSIRNSPRVFESMRQERGASLHCLQ